VSERQLGARGSLELTELVYIGASGRRLDDRTGVGEERSAAAGDHPARG
jgi:hypothetical protein